MDEQRRPKSFRQRFGIETGIDDARRQFVNRTATFIFDDVQDARNGVLGRRLVSAGVDRRQLYRFACMVLAERPGPRWDLNLLVDDDFDRCLQVLEAVYELVDAAGLGDMLSEAIQIIIDGSEVDLGISWQPPDFVPTGAKFLDERLVNDPLHWLDDPTFKTVYDPFQQGLFHFLESEQKPHLRKAVVRDMYEAVEALAKIVTGKASKDLSANAELFISRVKASESYKKLLKAYIAYANDFRHAEDQPGARPVPSRAEVESFLYLTGVFIRLAVQERE